MNANDKERMALEMVKAFIDITHSEDIRIGYVAYNDRILSSTSPLPISSAEERNALKKIIDTPGYSGNTDIGLGVHYAYEMLTKETDRRKVMILISDGESDLEGSKTGRDLDTSNQDLEYTLNRCKAEGIPIFTVAFGKYGGSKETLK